MKPGNSMTGTVNSIPFKCTKCGFLDPMEIDIAEEVCDLISYRVFHVSAPTVSNVILS